APTKIHTQQYDFQTTVTHELGHALGLGGTTDSNSPMFEKLYPGTARRTMTVRDFNIPDAPAGADALRAAISDGNEQGPGLGEESSALPSLDARLLAALKPESQAVTSTMTTLAWQPIAE